MPFTLLADAMGDTFSTGILEKSTPELLQQAFEALVSGDISKLTESFETLSTKMAALITSALDDLLAQFPMPASAPGHVGRVRSVWETVELAQKLLIQYWKACGFEQGMLEPYLAAVRPYVHELLVLLGDIAELYPTAIEVVVLNLSAVLLPEAGFTSWLLILYFFGPYGIGKDAIGEWVFRQALEFLKAQEIIV